MLCSSFSLYSFEIHTGRADQLNLAISHRLIVDPCPLDFKVDSFALPIFTILLAKDKTIELDNQLHPILEIDFDFKAEVSDLQKQSAEKVLP